MTNKWNDFRPMSFLAISSFIKLNAAKLWCFIYKLISICVWFTSIRISHCSHFLDTPKICHKQKKYGISPYNYSFVLWRWLVLLNCRLRNIPIATNPNSTILFDRAQRSRTNIVQILQQRPHRPPPPEWTKRQTTTTKRRQYLYMKVERGLTIPFSHHHTDLNTMSSAFTHSNALCFMIIVFLVGFGRWVIFQMRPAENLIYRWFCIFL